PNADVHGRTARTARCVRPLAETIQCNSIVRQQRCVAEQHLATLDTSLDASTSEGLEVLSLWQIDAELPRSIDNCFAKRVLGAHLGRCCESYQILLCKAIGDH